MGKKTRNASTKIQQTGRNLQSIDAKIDKVAPRLKQVAPFQQWSQSQQAQSIKIVRLAFKTQGISCLWERNQLKIGRRAGQTS